jgi:hypothetical protein
LMAELTPSAGSGGGEWLVSLMPRRVDRETRRLVQSWFLRPPGR